MYRIKIAKYTSQKADRKKSDDTWYYKFQKPGYNKNGGRLYAYKAGFPTKAAAEEAAEKEYLAIYGETSGTDVKTDSRISDMAFSSYVENHWWKVSVSMWKQGTVSNYRKYLKNYLIPRFGSIPISDISQEMLQNYFNSLYLSSHTSVNTINNLRTLMSQILKYACNNRHIRYNPMTTVQKPNLLIASAVVKKEQVRDAISDEIIDKILERFPQGTPAYVPFSLCLLAGLRIGEAFGLDWRDISFENHCIFVTRQLQRRERQEPTTAYEKQLTEKYPFLKDELWYLCNPKYESKRIIPMSSKLENILLDEKERQAYYRKTLGNQYPAYYYTRDRLPSYYTDFDSFTASRAKTEYENGIVNRSGIGYEIDFVNRYEDGVMITDGVLKHLSRVVRGKEKEPAIYEYYNTHSLRHTFASKLRASGMDEHVVQALLGHKSVKETKTYLHITAEEYMAVSLSMNGSISKVDALAKLIRSQNLSEQQLDALIHALKSAVS